MRAAKAKELASAMLSGQRLAHTANVAVLARELAGLYGADEEKAEAAAWLHDIMKEHSRETLLQMAVQDDIISEWFAHNPPPTWHGPAAALYLRTVHGCEDDELLAAIAGHTTGRAGMDLLEKIIYLADAASAERDDPGVDALRRLARQDLDDAVLAAMERTLSFLQETGRPIGEETLRAMQSLRQGKDGVQ